MTDWWLSSEKMTVLVTLDDRRVIVDAAPIVRRFIGQPAKNLGDWMRQQGGFRQERLP